MNTIELILLLISILVLLIYFYLVLNFNYWKKRGVDGPKPRPLFGNLPSIITKSRNLTYDIDDIYRAYKSKERFAGIFGCRDPYLLVIEPKLIQDVLITNFKNFHDNEFGKWIDKKADPVYGGNPFLLNGSEWKEKRAEMAAALTANRVKANYPVMQAVCAKMKNYLEMEITKPLPDGIDVKELATKYTIEVVANCVYGIEAGSFSSGMSKIREMGTKLMEQSLGLTTYLLLAILFPPLKKLYRMTYISKDVHMFFENLIKDAIKLRKENKSNRVDFLNYIIELKEKKNLSFTDISAHTMTFFTEGFESSSVLISNCLHLLAENEHAQNILRDEINNNFGKDKYITFEKLHDLPYLDQCINETLRLRPPLALSSKICTEACDIRTNKDKVIHIEKDTNIILPYYSIHHDEDFYPNPEKFDPNRFTEENGGAKNFKDMGVFLAFGDGPRICLGMKFALSQSKAAIVQIIRNWKITVNPKTKRDFVMDRKQLMCVPEGGAWIDFTQINVK